MNREDTLPTLLDSSTESVLIEENSEINHVCTEKKDAQTVSNQQKGHIVVFDLCEEENVDGKSNVPFEASTIDLTIEETETADSCAAAELNGQVNAQRVDYLNGLYASCLQRSLELLKESNLCNAAETPVVNRLLNLSPHALQVTGRVIFLQGPWFRASKAESYLIKAGMDCEKAKLVIHELIDAQILLTPQSEHEFHALLCSSVINRTELLSMLRTVDPKAKIQGRQELCERLQRITLNKQTIFGASAVKLLPLVRRAVKGNEILKVNPEAYILCRRAINVDQLFLDQFDFLDLMALSNADLASFCSDAEFRGSPRVPQNYSAGFGVAFGHKLDHTDEDTQRLLVSMNKLFPSKFGLLYLEACIDLCHAMLVCLQSNLDNQKRKEDDSESMDIGAGLNCNNEAFNLDGVFDEMEKNGCTSFLPMLKRQSKVDELTMDQLIKATISFVQYFQAQRKVEEDDRGNQYHHLRSSWDYTHYLGYAMIYGVTWLESKKQYHTAVEILRTILIKSTLTGLKTHRKRGEWWERLVIDLEHLGAKDVALEMCHLAMEDSSLETDLSPDLFGVRARLHHDEAHQKRLQDNPPRMSWNLEAPVVLVLAKPFGNAGKGSGAKGKQRFIDVEDSANVTCSVEEFALRHYADDMEGSWRGVHTENVALHQLFRVLMFEILQGHSMKDLLEKKLLVHRNRPLDLHSGQFYENRRESIDAYVAEMKGWTWTDILERVKTGYGEVRTSSRGHSLGMLQLIAVALGPTKLASLCLEMCRQFPYLGHGGGPDLLIVRTWSDLADEIFDERRVELFAADVNHADFRCEIRFVEVKSENDRLSNKQIFWLNTLRSLDISCEVLKVSVSGNTSVCRTPSMSSSSSKTSTRGKSKSEKQDLSSNSSIKKKPRKLFDENRIVYLGVLIDEDEDDLFED